MLISWAKWMMQPKEAADRMNIQNSPRPKVQLRRMEWSSAEGRNGTNADLQYSRAWRWEVNVETLPERVETRRGLEALLSHAKAHAVRAAWFQGTHWRKRGQKQKWQAVEPVSRRLSLEPSEHAFQNHNRPTLSAGKGRKLLEQTLSWKLAPNLNLMKPQCFLEVKKVLA